MSKYHDRQIATVAMETTQLVLRQYSELNKVSLCQK